MISDSFFEQGSTHEVCEDYAVNGYEYAVLSDGCSNGGGPRIDSDWGSRLLCKAAEQHLRFANTTPRFLTAVSETVQTQVRTFPGLDVRCLAATLLVLTHRDYKEINALVVGDGIVGGKRRDGRWKIYEIEFSRGAPYYLKYEMCGETEDWAKEFGGVCTVSMYFGKLLDPEHEVPEDFIYEERRRHWEASGFTAERSFNWTETNPWLTFNFPVDEYEFVFISSDGLGSFYQPRRKTVKYNEPIHVLDSARVALDMAPCEPGTQKPGFARAQRNWVFKLDRAGTFRRRNWVNGDDVSVGVMYCD
jgi:hypothetical protein